MKKYKIIIKSTEYFTYEIEEEDAEKAEESLLDKIDERSIEPIGSDNGDFDIIEIFEIKGEE